MLEREGTEDGWQVEFRPEGAAWMVLLLPAAFLGLWLCGWAVGEYVVGGLFLRGLRDAYAPGMALDVLPRFAVVFSRVQATLARGPAAYGLVFFGVWLAFWTFGGLSAMSMLLSLVAGRYHLRWNASGAQWVTSVGPFTRRRALTWSALDAMLDVIERGPTAPGTTRLPGVVATALRKCIDPADVVQLRGWLAEARAQGAASEPHPDVRAIG